MNTSKKSQKQADELYKKAIHFNERGDYGLAEEAFLKALVYFTKLQDWEKVVSCEMSVGNVCCNKNHFEDALDHWINALKIYEQSNLFTEAGELCISIGDLYYDQKNLWGAGHYYEKAKLHFSKDSVTNESNSGFANQKLGNVYYQIGQTEQAEKCYTCAIPILKKHSNLPAIAEIYTVLGHIHLSRSAELELAKIDFTSALELFRELKQENKIEEVSSILSGIDSKEKQKKLEQKVKQLERIVKPSQHPPASRESLAYSETDFSDFESENKTRSKKVPVSYSAAKYVPSSASSSVNVSGSVAPMRPPTHSIKSPPGRRQFTQMLANITNEQNYDEKAKLNKIKS